MADHKRRASWRLLGAVVLTGPVAAVAPLLLEENARPLARDLVVEMPELRQRDQSPPVSDVVQPPAKELAAEPEPLAAPKVDNQSASKSDVKAGNKVENKTDNKADTKTDNKSQGKAEKRVLVQVGAYAARSTAAAVQKRLESAGHRVQIEPTKTSAGQERYRVRVGPFESREAATEFRDRAKAQGYDAALVTVK